MRSRIALTLFLVCSLAPAGEGFAESTEALLRRRGEAFAAAMKAPEGRALEAFAAEHLAADPAKEDLAARFAGHLRAELAELGPVGRHGVQVLPGGRAVFVFLQRATSGLWHNYQFRVLPESGHRLQLVFRATAVEPLERPGTPLEAEASQRWLERFRRNLEAQQPFSGVALVRRRGREPVAIVQGTADAAGGRAVTRETRFGMASGSKMFTAVAILRLAQAGKLRLDASLATYLPSFPNAEFARRTTLHQLLTHTSGAGDYWDDAYEKAWDSITSLPQMLPFVLAHLGETPAGEYSYSNSGFILLGLVIEAVAGTSYFEYVDQAIFAPAGMRSTGFPLRSELGPADARPYLPEMEAGAVKPGSYRPAILNARGTSAGGASTTADDLLRFADALRSGALLDKTHLDLLIRPHVADGGGTDYGYGTMVDRSRGVLSYGHAGSARGTQFEFRIYPDLDTVLVVISNLDTIAGPELASALDHLIRNGAEGAGSATGP